MGVEEGESVDLQPLDDVVGSHGMCLLQHQGEQLCKYLIENNIEDVLNYAPGPPGA